VEKIVGFAHLRDTPNIDLAGCGVGDRAVAAVATASRGVLALDGTRLTNAGVQTIAARCEKLKRLTLRNTGITDEAVKALEQMTYLTELDVRGTKVTEAGARQLKKALPQCRIAWGEMNLFEPGVP
jgi:hypothetical protein